MKKIFYYLNILLAFVSCAENKDKINNQIIPDKLIDIDLNESDYTSLYICDKMDLTKFKEDLQNFRAHLDYKDTFFVNIYSYKNVYIAEMPKKINLGHLASLASWLEYGFAFSKNKLDANNDLIFCREDSLLYADFITAFSRNKKIFFKVDIVKGSFSGLKNNCYSYEIKDTSLLKYTEIIPAKFNLNEATLLEKNYVLEKAKPIEPYIDTTKQIRNSINI